MKKFILLMIIVTLAAMPVLSCAGEDSSERQQPNGGLGTADEDANVPGETEPGGQTEDALAFPDLPDVNFGGYNFRILNTGEEYVRWVLKTLVVEEETGHALNDAIFRRNRRMEERFGFNLVQTDFTGPGQVQQAARRSVNAASDDFDLAMMNPYQALRMAQEGQLEMLDQIPHIDVTQPWWDRDMIRDYSIGNRIFFASGDFSFNQYGATFALLFNKELHADLQLPCPYELVHAGQWTFERFAEMGRAGLRDLNGDGIIDSRDQWGLLAGTHVTTVAFMNGMGTRQVVKDADDLPVLNINTQGYIERFLKVFDILGEGWHYDSARPELGTISGMFENNQGLFSADPLNQATDLRAMDADFGILPMPKFNEQQEYHITGTGIPHVMAIPITTADLERTGIILEALSAESRLTTLTVYYDTMLVNQVMNRDEESAEMLEIIFANRIYELGRHFWNSPIASPLSHAMRDRNRDIVSLIETHEGAATAALEAAVDAFVFN